VTGDVQVFGELLFAFPDIAERLGATRSYPPPTFAPDLAALGPEYAMLRRVLWCVRTYESPRSWWRELQERLAADRAATDQYATGTH
jgi:hypothetical protein